MSNPNEYTAWLEQDSRAQSKEAQDDSATLEQDELANAATAITWGEPAYLYLERRATTWLDDTARQHVVQLQRYDASIACVGWEAGRIFDLDQELRWEPRAGKRLLVYCGPKPPPGFMLEPLEAVTHSDESYYTWGRPLRPEQRSIVSTEPDDEVFIELRVPRLLRYPVPGATRRIQVLVREFYAADGSLCYARWRSLRQEPEARENL